MFKQNKTKIQNKYIYSITKVNKTNKYNKYVYNETKTILNKKQKQTTTNIYNIYNNKHLLTKQKQKYI